MQMQGLWSGNNIHHQSLPMRLAHAQQVKERMEGHAPSLS